MSVHAAITHKTLYKYERPALIYPQIVRLRPAPHCRTPILSYSLKIEPEEHFLNWQQDPFGNWLARLVFPEKAKTFSVTVDLVADMAAINPFDFFLEDSATHVPFTYDDATKHDLGPYLKPIPFGKDVEAIARDVEAALAAKSSYETNTFLVDINQRVQSLIGYTIRMEPGVQTPDETVALKLGSCRDSAWLLIALLRRLGYAARFVSGYLLQLTTDVKSVDGGPDGPEKDFTDLHAWAEVYLPGAGWVGLDPTSGLFAGEGHIPLAATPDPSTAAPITGAVQKVKTDFAFDMEIRRVYERPRVTWPVSDEQWAEIDAVGHAIDDKLASHDVRLTMGGEPTFVASTNRDADEWNTGAVGPTKRSYADAFIRRLRDRFAPGGMLHYGQGKWYPGEQLPRWAFALYWRTDGVPLWGDQHLIAKEPTPGVKGGTRSAAEAETFSRALAQSLGLAPENAQPAYEDPAEFMLREAKLAPNVDPIDNKLDDAEERQRLARVFDRGLETPAGFVLPIQAAQARGKPGDSGPRRRFVWKSERWHTRRGRLFLIPGDSPAGFRLPLRALTYISPESTEYPHVHAADPFAARGALPARAPELQSRFAAPAGGDGAAATGPGARPAMAPGPDHVPLFDDESGVPWIQMEDIVPGGAFIGGGPAVRTAIAIEPRGTAICVFMPPVATADEYVDLIHAIEESAAETGLPVHVEGYPPPSDSRINVIKVTPDPGVIEINVQPAHNWSELRDITEGVYEEARFCGLEASKFMHDGRPTGSGGGAHVVVGGASAADSPFLRRPDVLGSLIRFWQRHPSLSYLFSGMFIGPTSQAPRIDEARHDSLYELEIALRQIPNPLNASGGECPPWLVDRLLRNLLIDVTGNTHRAEICIDKLFSPDGPTGRLGLVEFRAFEMPPHPRMNLSQQLLLRALIAWFWEKPYTRPFERFGTGLHDRFMLPHFVWSDFLEVLDEVSSGLGLKIDPDWFKSQFEFRFPRYGAVQVGDLEVELRAAIEPWHVLGEEGAIGGTARYVDSSVERLQARLVGDAGERYALACNGWRVPMKRTGDRWTSVAGIRFRAWAPPSSLHPTIPPHGPLVFDVVDTWNGRAVGGCTYHVAHPGGRSYENQPINALEAEGRRLARFDAFGHTPGAYEPRTPRMSDEFPHTLDLRNQDF